MRFYFVLVVYVPCHTLPLRMVIVNVLFDWTLLEHTPGQRLLRIPAYLAWISLLWPFIELLIPMV